jgi:hypothetical protein
MNDNSTRPAAMAADLSQPVPVATVVSAPYAAEGPLVAGTSFSSNSIDTVTNKTFLINEYNRSFFPGTRVRATAVGFSNVWLEGIVITWDGSNVTMDGDLASGTGVYSNWNINVAGQPGAQGATGPTGPTGPSGGPVGPAGPTGPPGSVWRTGSGAPANSLGVNGDYYLDSATDDVWLRSGGFYSVVSNIGGAVGPVGPTGLTGPQGIIEEAPLDGGFYARKNGGWAAPPGGGNVSAVGTPVTGQLARWTSSNTIEGYAPTNYAPLDTPIFTGDPKAPTPATGDNDTSIATTAFVKAQNYITASAVSGLLSASVTAMITVGYTFTPYNLGNIPTPYTPNAALGNYQYGNNNGAFTINAPGVDCALDILITNTSAAGAITFSGYTVGATGDPFTTVSGQKFMLSIRRINAISTYTVKALQ